MTLPDLSRLRINGEPPPPARVLPSIPDDIANCDPSDGYMLKLKNYARSLPYSIESHSKMMELLDFICLRITQCVEARDFDVGMPQWDTIFN